MFKKDEKFLEYLKGFRFTGDLWAVSEGTVLFPNEPFLRIEAPIIQAQLFETYVLSMVNYQTLIASKVSRIVNSSGDKPVVEFGFRRHGAGGVARVRGRHGGHAGRSAQ